MKFLQEITDWEHDIPNHIYLLNDSKSRMTGYVPANSDQLVIFSEPLGFSARYRKFREVPDQWNYADTKSENRTWQVAGSKGNYYTVEQSDAGLICSCSGFGFRGKCKHITQIPETA